MSTVMNGILPDGPPILTGQAQWATFRAARGLVMLLLLAHGDIGIALGQPLGRIVGSTYRDLQHFNSTGRQIDQRLGFMRVAFTYENATGTIEEARYNSVQVVGPVGGVSPGWLPLGIPATLNGAPLLYSLGFPNLRLLPSGRPAYAHNASGWTSCPNTFLVTVDDPTLGPVPCAEGTCGFSEVLQYPKLALEQVGSDVLMHVVSYNVEPPGGPNEIWYNCYFYSGGNCALINAMPLESSGNRSFVIEKNPTSTEVAVVYTRPQAGGGDYGDIIVRSTTDQGSAWTTTNVTNYASSAPDRAYLDVDALFDMNGELHVVWTSVNLGPPALTNVCRPAQDSPCDLYHWSPSTGIHRITVADWINSCAGDGLGTGADNLLISKPSLSVKPAGVYGIASELIYVVWTQFGPTSTDCSAQGYVFGELYSSRSSNNGLTWSRPQNISGTPGRSEHWVTTAVLADSGLYLSYVDDGEAGSAFEAGEGSRTNNNYRVNAWGTAPPILDPCAYAAPRQIQLCIPPGGTVNRTLEVAGLCNSALTYNVTVSANDNGQSYVRVNGGVNFSGTIAAGASSASLNLSFNGASLSEGDCFNWRLQLTSNDPMNDPGQGGTPIEISVDVLVSTMCSYPPGDVNKSGALTSADIIQLVSYVFKGGPAPAPCPAIADVDCSGQVTSSDVINMVGVVFKGGCLRCDPRESSTLRQSCCN